MRTHSFILHLRPAISTTEFKLKQQKITEKSCLCVGLANASYLENDMPIKGQQQGVVICPGPNLAYFDKEYSLQENLNPRRKNTNMQSSLPPVMKKM